MQPGHRTKTKTPLHTIGMCIDSKARNFIDVQWEVIVLKDREWGLSFFNDAPRYLIKKACSSVS